MRCNNCGNESGRIRTYKGVDSCHLCGDFKEAGGARTTGILTRNSLRVRQDAVIYEGDTIHPYEMDKTRKKLVPNREFIKKFPEQAHEYFTDEALVDAGHTKLPAALARKKLKTMQKIEKEESKVQFIGDQTVRQKEVLA